MRAQWYTYVQTRGLTKSLLAFGMTGGKMHRIVLFHQTLFRQYICGFLLVLFTLTGTCLARAKKDVIQFNNGDRITCEIIKLEKGYLYVKLDYADGTVAMDWSKIARIESPQSFVVADKGGNRYTGSLQQVTGEETPEGTEEPRVQVTGLSTSEVVSTREVVGMSRTDTSFWQNLHGGLNAGFNFAKQQRCETEYHATVAKHAQLLHGIGGVSSEQ